MPVERAWRVVVSMSLSLLVSLGCATRSETLKAPTPSPPAPASPAPAPAGPDAPASRGEEVTSTEPPEEAGESPGPSTGVTSEERTARLEGELRSSIRELDDVLLREQELVEERQAMAQAGAGGGPGGGAPGDAGSGPSGANGGTGEGSREEGGEPASEVSGGTGGSPDASPRDGEPGAPAGGSTGESDNGRVPPDVGDGSDDDIVARQLREAAMAEDDPELREKLWDEYRSYKSGTESRQGDEGVPPAMREEPSAHGRGGGAPRH